jgi:hypothetical protein
LLASYREVGDSLGEARIIEAMTIDDPAVALAAGPGPRLYFTARYDTRWGLYFAPRPHGDVEGVPIAVAKLAAESDLSSSGERLFVLSNRTLLAVRPLGSARTIATDAVPASQAQSTPGEIAASANALWTARGSDLRRIDLETTESANLQLAGVILSVDSTAAGPLFVLIRDKGTSSLIRLVQR